MERGDLFEPEGRNERFVRLAEKRVNVVLDKFRLLGQLSNTGNYVYTDDQVNAIFRAIQKELASTKSKFQDGNARKRKFKLPD